MRKFYWCCLAGGAAACLAVGTAAYIWRNPDSTLGRLAFAGPPPRAASTDAPGTAPGDDVIPPDPVPVEEPSDPPAIPVLPGAAPQPPQTVAVALTPPIIIHDEEDLNAASLSGAKPKTPAAAPVDVEASRPTTSDVVENEQRPSEDPLEQPSSGPPMMPYCSDDAGSAPYMPYCTDDDPAPIMPAAGDDGEAGRERRPSDAWAWQLGFLSGPTQLSLDPADGVRRADAATRVNPLQLFGRPHRLHKARPSDPRSDTMEMRPSDWKPYNLDPGPY